MRYILLLLILLFAACSPSRKLVSAGEMQCEDSYEESGSGSIGDMLGGLMGGSGGSISTRAYGSMQAPANLNYQPERMIHYNGSITLESPEPEAVIDTVIQKAAAKGGYMSSRRNGHVSLQIPVAEFRVFFEYILSLGAVISKSIWANDITDQYADNNSRLLIAQTALARYKELLALAKSEQEKLSLLKEIQRLSEIIEQREIQEKEFLKKAAFSKIELDVNNAPEPEPMPRAIQRIDAFHWFYDLESNRTIIGKAIELSIPKNFIKTKNTKKCWRSASALNSEFWAFEKENNPQGNVDFWANAILDFFKDNYKAELIKAENYSLIRLQTADAEPRVFYIAVLKITDDKNLRIAESYFPNLEAEKANGDAVKEALGGVK